MRISPVLSCCGTLCLLAACASGQAHDKRPTLACTEAVSVMAHVSGLKVGTERIMVSVFPQPASIESPPSAPPPSVHLRFFHQTADAAHPGQEIRRYLPESAPHLETGNIAPLPTPMGVVNNPITYAVNVPFDAPGTWGVEVFVRAPWQQSPAITTLMFRVAAAEEESRTEAARVSVLPSGVDGFIGIPISR